MASGEFKSYHCFFTRFIAFDGENNNTPSFTAHNIDTTQFSWKASVDIRAIA